MTEAVAQGVAGTIMAPPCLPEFPIGASSGTYDQTLQLGVASSYNPDFVAAHSNSVALAANSLFNELGTGRAYFNLQTDAYPGGGIADFLKPAPGRLRS